MNPSSTERGESPPPWGTRPASQKAKNPTVPSRREEEGLQIDFFRKGREQPVQTSKKKQERLRGKETRTKEKKDGTPERHTTVSELKKGRENSQKVPSTGGFPRGVPLF